MSLSSFDNFPGWVETQELTAGYRNSRDGTESKPDMTIKSHEGW